MSEFSITKLRELMAGWKNEPDLDPIRDLGTICLEPQFNIPPNYHITVGVIVWWVGGYAYPSEAKADRVADRVEQIFGDRPKVTTTIEHPQTLQRAIEQRKTDREPRAKEAARFARIVADIRQPTQRST